MPGTRIEVSTADGVMDAYLHAPAGQKPAAVVVLFTDAYGVRPAMHQMCERLAAVGYLVAMPNVFYRSGNFASFDPKTAWTDPAERDRLMAVLKKAEAAGVMRDTQSLLEALARRPEATVDAVGLVGYCMGGRLAFIGASTFPERVAAAASIHGGNLATDAPDSPHRQAGRIRGRLYFGVADNDRSCTPESQAQLRSALDAARVRYELEVYPGAQHGFAVPGSPAHDAVAAEKQWQRVLALFSETLPRS